MSYPVLKVGSKGPEVVTLKAMLAAKGAHPSSDDPQFYSKTAESVIWFQQTHVGSSGKFLIETEPKGVVTEEVWMALEGRTPQKLGIKPPAVVKDKLSLRRAFLDQLKKRHEGGVGEIPKGSNWGDGVKDCIKWNGFDEPIPWCNAEMNYDLGQVGASIPWGKSCRVCVTWNKARKEGVAFRVGEVKPCPGDLFVMIHKGLKKDGTAYDSDGHIGAVAGVGSDYILTYEGNSDDRFRAGRRSISSIVGFIQLFPYEDFKFGLGKYESSDGAKDR